MLPLAAINVPALVSLVIGVLGLSGLVFTALRFRRDDTTAVVQQQSVVFDDLKMLNEELRTTLASMRIERDTYKANVNKLEGQVEVLTTELHEAQAQLTGKMTRIERKQDDGA